VLPKESPFQAFRSITCSDCYGTTTYVLPLTYLAPLFKSHFPWAFPEVASAIYAIFSRRTNRKHFRITPHMAVQNLLAYQVHLPVAHTTKLPYALFCHQEPPFNLCFLLLVSSSARLHRPQDHKNLIICFARVLRGDFALLKPDPACLRPADFYVIAPAAG
jgi:hypothetical protein